MQFSIFRHFSGGAFAALALAVPAVARAQSGYTLVDLGVGNGYAINASGQVTGNNGQDTVRWTGTTETVLGAFGAFFNTGYAINASGQIAGAGRSSDGYDVIAFSWMGAALTARDALGGDNSFGYAINQSGEVAGFADLRGNTSYHATVWTGTDFTPTDLGALGGDYSQGLGINDRGQVVGWAATAYDILIQAVVWTGTNITVLNGLGGPYTYGVAINNSGQVAGTAYTPNEGPRRAVLWNGIVPTDLGTLGGEESFGNAINTSGDVVGFSYRRIRFDDAAFLYSKGRMIDLNTLLPTDSGWYLTTAQGINDSGWITGQGIYRGAYHAYILRPNQNTVFGSLALEGISDLNATSPAAPLGSFRFSFRLPGTTSEVYSASITPTIFPKKSYGSFAVSNIPSGVYDIAIKGAKNLQVVLPNIVISGNVALPDVLLPAGDANNDNSCDTSDFGVLVGAYGGDSSVPGSGYDAAADFNFDGMVNTSDFGLLVGEYGNVGAP